ncbi:hypothetical protein Tco_1551968, partial [Tanacetum coccineum]
FEEDFSKKDLARKDENDDTTGTHRTTPRALSLPIVSTASPSKRKKRKKIVGESSSPRKTIKRKKQSTPSTPPPRDDAERDAIAEATLLSLTLQKTTLVAKAQENIVMVQEALEREGINKMVDGDEDEESYASEFADSKFNDDVDDSRNKIDLGSHKEHPEHVSDDEKVVVEMEKCWELKTFYEIMLLNT